MFIIPAMHLKDGHCVRLQNSTKDVSPLTENPQELVKYWLENGAQRLHLVDICNGLADTPKNLPIIREILSIIDNTIPVQLSGGVRNLETIEKYLDAGLQYITIGAAAIKTPGFLHEACDAFPGHIIVGLDAKEGKVVTDGWTKTTHHDVIDLAKRFEDYGVEAVIYTDMGAAGTNTEVNIETTVKLAENLHIPVIASGDVTKLDHIRSLCAVADEGISSVITRGYVMQDHQLSLKEAQKLADELSEA